MQQASNPLYLTVVDEYAERKGRREENNKALDDIRSDYIEVHRPYRNSQNQEAEAYVDVATVEADDEEPYIVPPPNLQSMTTRNLLAVFA